MTGYHDHSDLEYLAKVKEAAPKEFQAWARLDGIVSYDGGSIPRKYRELIAIAVAHTTQCVYCIDIHTEQAVKVGATRSDVAEAALLAAALRAGGAGAHSALTMKLYDQYADDSDHAGDVA